MICPSIRQHQFALPKFEEGVICHLPRMAVRIGEIARVSSPIGLRCPLKKGSAGRNGLRERPVDLLLGRDVLRQSDPSKPPAVFNAGILSQETAGK
jgi:hypothetical protein